MLPQSILYGSTLLFRNLQQTWRSGRHRVIC